MGEIAAQTLVNQIEGHDEGVAEIAIEPEFVVRDSTAIVGSGKKIASVRSG
jgi:DNA-binding LacI/PurR family transcriptional regulator